ncbi:MAG: AAA family ATPase [Chloroflexota bacterium]|nr:AAA family ATPase [Chloroflexota bacterium]
MSVNRRELINIPLLRSHALWRNLRVRKGNAPLRIVIEVHGVEGGREWVCAMEFETVDQDNIRCRPISSANVVSTNGIKIPDDARSVRMAFLPPMSGLVSQEDLLQPGSIERRIGEGRTADVLRNLCYRVYSERPEQWQKLQQQMRDLFGTRLLDPVYEAETGILSLEYEEQGDARFDLNSSGQGFRQTLLLLAYLYSNENTVMLLDEPDAHLELLRQRQIYNTLTDAARTLNNQIIIATHSEVILNEAVKRDLVIAFIGKPHRISRAAVVYRALADYGYEEYAQAEQRGFVLYLEGSTDLAILQTLASHLQHPAEEALRAPFVHYVANQPNKAIEHYRAVLEAFSDLVGMAIFDRLERGLPEDRGGIEVYMWQRRELENYIVTPDVLRQYAVSGLGDSLFDHAERQKRTDLMERLLTERIPPIALNNPDYAWWVNTKMTDDFLDELFQVFYEHLELPNTFRKSDYHQLAPFLPRAAISPEISDVLDRIAVCHLQGQNAVKTRLNADEQIDLLDDSDAPQEE